MDAILAIILAIGKPSGR